MFRPFIDKKAIWQSSLTNRLRLTRQALRADRHTIANIRTPPPNRAIMASIQQMFFERTEAAFVASASVPHAPTRLAELVQSIKPRSDSVTPGPVNLCAVEHTPAHRTSMIYR
ncbi:MULTISPECIES: hypothetical protein [unclassified Paraburkholderia]|uniref:hypothetical protein n=1 Tax=unclassified Paraburkholderia TaxID=2615204 RepID=UPI00160C8014|nr:MULTISPECIES: hypothetical protein [unclassified Paraburkholderia]MBB5442875.1 hypothetical protein [Paraburkholderia sp. WSM4177]MBB5483520.1 hypothetical protein [Paraburkholderia sp. WSM4180]